MQLGAGALLWAASAGGGGGHHAAAAAGGLRQLARHFHASLGLPAAAEGASPAMNPLQQAPTPAGGAAAAAAGASPLGPAPVSLAGGEVSTLARAIARGISISPHKLNDFAKVVRGLPIQDALIQCRMSPKKSAKLVEKALLSAQANAVNNQGLEAERLRVAEAWVGKGQNLKRTSMHGRGRSGKRLKYRSHLTVLLREEEEEPRRRTRIVPMMAERHKLWRMREAQGVPQP
ncbi:hypothetical protein CHLNCDRAFT_136009 [Chlorella variabilis]|uniref:Large ribosomal subunit protein uL22c n=1 Tax=Chlorella variabilis TaxID=554065 RepID=E1ZJJ4_CHLVA|nr:hypothetical protein CHLNCDRAFT_136009 [Chlorella variabilis]EFN53873.1 hypothetical protein CHLNCDRAFT_136009 [Chlorella variabilis]|eukprot:XP_005845975.1 hypothetical protein CHLNCDRAFT_136009 [Chlorella variabilis]